jgi:hypothetical protein
MCGDYCRGVLPSFELPGYDLLEVLGHGGHAYVQRARQQAVAGRDVALKIYRQPLGRAVTTAVLGDQRELCQRPHRW